MRSAFSNQAKESTRIMSMATSRPQVLSDCYDLPVTTSAHEALAWFNRGIHGLLGFRKDTPDCFHKALAHDATFNMAHCYLGVPKPARASNVLVNIPQRLLTVNAM
jgi:hypothetical protein